MCVSDQRPHQEKETGEADIEGAATTELDKFSPRVVALQLL